MNPLKFSDSFCKNARIWATCLLLAGLVSGLSGCSPRSEKAKRPQVQHPGPETPTPGPTPGPVQNNETNGPSVGGGGGIFKPESKEEVIDIIYRVRRSLQNEDLYHLILSGVGLPPDPKSERDRKLYGKLAFLLEPGNNYENKPWETDANMVKNTLVDYIDDIQLDLREQGPCSVTDNHHADASVTPMDRTGVICFSLENLMQQSTFALESVVAGLWFHELAHMNGYNEDDADLVQEVMEQAYSHIGQRYYSAVSKLYRSAFDDSHRKLEDLGELLAETTPDKADVGKEVTILKERIGFISEMLWGFDRTKTCQFIDDNNHVVIRQRILNASQNLSSVESGFVEYDYLSVEDARFRLDMVFQNLFIASDWIQCEAKAELICENDNHRQAWLNARSTQVNDAYEEFLEKYFESSYLKKDFLDKGHALENLNASQDPGLLLLVRLVNKSLEMHIYLNNTLKKLRELKKALTNDIDCLEGQDEELRQAHLAKLEEAIEKFEGLNLSPLVRHYTREQQQFFSDYLEKTEITPEESGHLWKKINREGEPVFVNDQLLKKLLENMDDDRERYKSGHDILRWLYHADTLSRFLG